MCMDEDLVVLASVAAAFGHVDVVRWWLDRLNDDGRSNWHERFARSVLRTAAGSADCSRAAVIELFSLGAFVEEELGCALLPAVIAGRLELLQALHAMCEERSLPSFEDTEEWECSHTGVLCATAAANGHLDLLVWLHTVAELPCHAQVCYAAAENGHDNVLEWALSHDIPLVWDDAAMSAQGVPASLRQRYGDASSVATSLAERGKLELLQTVKALGAPVSVSTAAAAAAKGHLHVLQWLRRSANCPWDSGTSTQAAANGHLDVLQWVRTEECPWDHKTVIEAARHGHVSLLRWALSNKCPGSPKVLYMLTMVVRGGKHAASVDDLQFALEHGCALSREALLQAARSQRLDVLQWMHARLADVRTPRPTDLTEWPRRAVWSELHATWGGGHPEGTGMLAFYAVREWLRSEQLECH